MVRQGRYTQRVSLVARAKRSLRRRWRWFKELSRLKKFLLIAGPIFIFLLVVPLLTYAYFARDIGDQERLMNRNNTGIVLKDKNGEVFYSTGRSQTLKLVPLSDISDNVKKALIASEDKDFYEHKGFAPLAILRAFYNNLVAREVTGGGSTITQQLAKNTLLSDNQTFLRKYQELTVAIAIEQNYTKDQILEMYLNSAFFGGHTFGIDEAAKFYFNKSAKDLTLAESSMLVGILPAPNAYSPTLGNPQYAKERQNTVLTRMVANGFITQADKDAAIAESLTYAPVPEENSAAPHFTEMVLNELYDKYGEEKVTRSGYQVTTTLDLNLQRQAEKNMANNMAFIQRNGGSNASLIAIDPKAGEIRALIGSADYNNQQFGKVNMVTTPRQPGSSFKPVYYSQALAGGIITPATILADVPTDFGGYSPQNASRTFSGDISVRNALARSLNIPSVKVMQKLGVQTAVDDAKKMGITTLKNSSDYGLSLALGSAEIPLIEMTNVYAGFANGGLQYGNTTLSSIDDKFSSRIYDNRPVNKRIISVQGAFLISSILSDNSARAPVFGSSLTVSGKQVAVKTGTTDDQRDAWTIGYTPELAIGVWVGNNDNSAMKNGGSGMAGPIWRTTMQNALSSVTSAGFSPPAGIAQIQVCRSNGLRAPEASSATYGEYFLTSAEPTGNCQVAQPEPTETKKEDAEPTETPTAPTTPSAGGSGNASGGAASGGSSTGNGSSSGTGNTNPGTTPSTPSVPSQGTLPGGSASTP